MLFSSTQEPEPAAREARPRRRWKLPVPPVGRLCELPGAGILEEVRPHALAVALWQRLCDVDLWARGERARGGLFHAEAGSPARRPWLVDTCGEDDLAAPLLALTMLVLAPEKASETSVADACSQVAAWAARRGYPATQAAFTILAATVSPRDARLAAAAGRMAREQGNHDHSMEWYKLSIGLARRVDQWDVYAGAYLGLGLTEESIGNRENARAMHLRGYRCARRNNLRSIAARARHNMIALSVPDRPFEEGQEHIVAALKMYSDDDPRFPFFVGDAAAFWAWWNYHTAAITLYQAVIDRIPKCPERFVFIANIARSSAIVGNQKRFFSACDEVLANETAVGPILARTLSELADGARILGHKLQARDLAEYSLRLALQQGDGIAAESARRVSSALWEDGHVERDMEIPPRIRKLVRQMLRRLDNWSPPV